MFIDKGGNNRSLSLEAIALAVFADPDEVARQARDDNAPQDNHSYLGECLLHIDLHLLEPNQKYELP